MKSKQQKEEELEIGIAEIEKSKNVVFADFSGVGVELLRKLKKELKETGATFKVIKKRLLKIAFEKKGIDFDPTQFDAQVGAIFLPGELSDTAGVIHKFSRELAKEKKEFTVLGAYDLTGASALTADEFTIIAKLPSREVLLAQLANVLSGPMRAFVYVLDQMSKKSGEVTAEASAEEVSEEKTEEAPQEETKEETKEEISEPTPAGAEEDKKETVEQE